MRVLVASAADAGKQSLSETVKRFRLDRQQTVVGKAEDWRRGLRLQLEVHLGQHFLVCTLWGG